MGAQLGVGFSLGLAFADLSMGDVMGAQLGGDGLCCIQPLACKV